MSFFNGYKHQLRTVIEWKNPCIECLFSLWSENGDEIKQASRLIVTQGQGCIFIYQGQVKAIITQPCIINLATDSLPFLTILRNTMRFFKHEHKVALYFFKTSQLFAQKWGTSLAISYEDPTYKFPVDLQAFGHYRYQITHPSKFFSHIIDNQTNFSAENFRKIMTTCITHSMSNFLAESHFTYTEIKANRHEITIGLNKNLQTVFHNLGLRLTHFYIKGTRFSDDSLEQMNQMSNISPHEPTIKSLSMDTSYLQQLEAMRDAIRNESGGAGFGLGTGMGLGHSLAEAFHNTRSQSPSLEGDPINKLEQLKKMVETELNTPLKNRKF